MKFTNQFKATVFGLILVAVLVALFANQVLLGKQVRALQDKGQFQVVKTVVVTPTMAPTATPTAALRFVPVRRVTVTTAPTK